ncbi:unnamed protein product [Ophioblennius macclurei]
MDRLSVKTFLFLVALLGRAVANSVLPEGPVDAVLGKNVTLKTLLKEPVYSFIIWNYSDGTESVHVATAVPVGDGKVNEPYLGRVVLDKTKGDLTLIGLRSTDTGDYSINVVDAAGTTQTGEIKLRVLEPVSDVVIKSDKPEAVETNDTVVITCTAKGSFLKFVWLNGTTEVVPDGRRVILHEEESSSQLTFHEVLRSDLKGPIFCKVDNKMEGDKSAPFNLTVHYGPDNVMIHPAKPAQYIKARSNFSLTCSSTSSPASTYQWFYNQEQVKTEGPVLTLEVIEKLGHGKKEGVYTCTATNAKTKRTVRSPPVTFGVMEPISGTKLNGPTGVLMAGNHSANLSCTSTAGVVQTTTWLKDGKPLRSSGVVFSADKSSVLISPLLKEDNGKFTCTLSNAVNSEEAVYTMVVNYGPEAAKVEGQEAVEVEDPIELACSASSQPPATYTWKFNGTVTPIKTAKYTIDKARYKDSGTYTCEAINAVTGKKSSQTFTLSVKEELVEGLSDGAIAGIVIAVLVALAAAIGLVFYCRQKVPVDSPY